MTDTTLATFEDTSLPLDQFTHRVHLYVAWRYLKVSSLGVAGERFSVNLRRYAAAHGRANLFHHTLTWAYLVLIQERLSDEPSFESFEARNPDLFNHREGALRTLYDDHTLTSPLAKHRFLLPRPSLQRRHAPSVGGSVE